MTHGRTQRKPDQKRVENMVPVPDGSPVEDAIEDVAEDAAEAVVEDVAEDVAEDAAEAVEDAAEAVEDAAEAVEDAAEVVEDAAPTEATEWQLSVERRLTEHGLAIGMLAGVAEEQAENLDAVAQDVGEAASEPAGMVDAMQDANPAGDPAPKFDDDQDDEEPQNESWFFRSSKRKKRK